MNCEKCGTPLESEDQVCPVCAESEAAETPTAPEPAEEESVSLETAEVEESAEDASEEVAETADENPEENTALHPEDEPDSTPKKRVAGGLIAIIAVLVLAIGAVVFYLAGGLNLLSGRGEIPASFIYEAEHFTDKELDRKVATCGSSTLTNRSLAYYYWSGFYTLGSSYGSYFSAILPDPTARLDTVSIADGTTWDQMLMESAIKSFGTIAAAAQEAEKAGVSLPEGTQTSLDSLETTIASYAETYGYESAEAYLQSSFGPYTTLADYRAYLEEYYLGNAYLNEMRNSIVPTPEDLSAFYDAHAEEYRAEGLEKDDTKMVNVRHILITPASVEIEEGEEGYEAAVAEARAEALTKAEDIYQQWQSGDATEDSFAALAAEYTTDPGSSASGGLYTDVYPGRMVPSFDAWCFDENRRIGDTDIVETDYGYHIMFFSGHSDRAYWELAIENDFITDRYNGLLEELTAAYPIKQNLKHAAIYPCNTELG